MLPLLFVIDLAFVIGVKSQWLEVMTASNIENL